VLEPGDSRENSEPLVAPAFIKPKTAEVPIIMYHLITKNGKYIGKHGITPEELESDLNHLKNNGYNTILMADLISFVHNGKKLPDKPIVLTFDDGNGSDYRYVFALLEIYDMKAVLSVMGKITEEYTEQTKKDTSGKNEPRIFPNLTWQQINEMYESGRVEIQNHSYNLHGPIGSMKRKGEADEAYRARLKEDLSLLQKRIREETGFIPTTFTYPLGAITPGSQPILKELDFKASLSCTHGMNRLTENEPECLFRLKRDNRPSGRHISTVLQRMPKAVN
jgi:peptidoglycan/xylan/chitin deacetylase (PgdA/CDA1 family)